MGRIAQPHEGIRGIMKNGLWISALVLALLARGADLIADDAPWQAVSRPSDEQPATVTLGRPLPLPAAPENASAIPAPFVPPTAPLAASTPAPLPSGIVPVGYEAPQSSPQPPSPAPTIIAVSAPGPMPGPPPMLPDTSEGEPTEGLFAIERRARPNPTAGRPVTPPNPVNPVSPAAALYGQWNTPGSTLYNPWSTPPAAPAADFLAGAAFNPLQQRFYLDGEYLLWWIKGDSLPVLATTSSVADSGTLGSPSTAVLFGGNAVNSGPFSGGRFTAGYWLDCCEGGAVEVSGLFLGQRSAHFATSSFTNSLIGRPFFDVNNNHESAQLTAQPGVATGALTINSPTSLWGLEGNFLYLLCCGCNYRVAALAGFRNLNLDESLSITENVQALATAPPPFTSEQITVFDRFATQNHFYGGQVGADARWYWGRFSLDVRGKLALGATVQQLDISGGQRFVSPLGTVQNFTGGLLALPGNIGHFSSTAFSVIPEVGVNVGYQIFPHLRGFVGYNFLFWSNVIRPGTSIDRGLDVTKIPNFQLNPEPAPVSGLHPAPVFHNTGFWAQGINFGLEFTY
jgi:hypothetical protein